MESPYWQRSGTELKLILTDMEDQYSPALREHVLSELLRRAYLKGHARGVAGQPARPDDYNEMVLPPRHMEQLSVPL